MIPRRFYVDAGWGQVHGLGMGEGPRLLACLHATAYSARSMAPLLPLLAHGGRVVALDTPGYGASDGPAEPVPFAAYATAMGEALARLSPDGPVDLFGYHTGALIATELAAQRPDLVRSVALVGVPFFEGADHAEWRAKLVHPTTLRPELEQFGDRWRYLVTERSGGVSLERGFANFVDELSCYPREWWAHAALFEYDARPRLALLRCPVLVINPTTPLAAASRAAAACIMGAVVEEAPEISGAPFDTAAANLAGRIKRFLTGLG